MTAFREYDVVRVTRISDEADYPEVGCRSPQIGDVGAIVMVHSGPTEICTVECVSADGHTEWLFDFRPSDLEVV